MSRSFLTGINLNQNQLLNAQVQNLAAAPSSPVAGQIYYDTVKLGAFVYNGSTWAPTDASLSTNIPTTAIPAFASTVQGYHLNQFAAPTANIPMAGYTLTGLNTAPSAAGQAAEYSWVIGQIQSAAAGIASKPPVQCIATANITLSGLQTIDGYTTLANDRVLVAGQSTASANGVYNAASGAWTRVTDDGAAPGEIEPGAMWLVVNGTTYGGTQWRCSNTGSITIGTTSITMVQFGAASVYSAGNGITLTGTSFAVNAASSAGSGGPGGGLVVSGSGVAIDTNVVTRKYSATIGDGSTTAIVVTHNLGTQDVMMQVKMASTPYSTVECDMAATSTTTATFTFATAPASGAYRVIVLG